MLSGAMPGWPFDGLLNNGIMTATRSLTLLPDGSGQEIAGATETLVFEVYIKKINGSLAGRRDDNFSYYEGGGVTPVGVDSLSGFADRILPQWALQQADIKLVSDDLGEGIFEPQPNVRPARPLVEAETGSYLFGNFIKNK